jgi:hypothetical protein
MVFKTFSEAVLPSHPSKNIAEHIRYFFWNNLVLFDYISSDKVATWSREALCSSSSVV